MQQRVALLDIYWIKIMKQTFKTFSILGLLLMTSACADGGNTMTFRPSMFDDTNTTQRQIVIEEKRYIDKKPIKDISYDYLMGLSNDYDRHGNSPVYVVLGYDPDVRDAKLSTFNKSNIIRGQLAKLGMRDAVVKTMPISGSHGEAVIAYDRVTAKGPEDCGEMPGLQTQTGAYGDYGLGCAYKSAMAKQIAYPKDLMGQDKMDDWDADRGVAAIDRSVRSGEPAPFVPSYVLSELAGNTTE